MLVGTADLSDCWIVFEWGEYVRFLSERGFVGFKDCQDLMWSGP